jgi:hypothetical protein
LVQDRGFNQDHQTPEKVSTNGYFVMKVGDLVKPLHQELGPLIGLVTRIREFDTRDDVVYVQWSASPHNENIAWTHVNRWYDVSNLSKIDETK